jgi:iron(III) transport system substrate-binding protein
MFRNKMISVLLVGCLFLGVSQTFAAEDQSKLIEGAKKEGKVIYWASGLTPELVKAIEEGFKKKYGLRDFQVVYASSRTTEIVAKVSQELMARRLTVDIITGSMPEFFYDLLKAGEVMKYESPEYKYFKNMKGLLHEPGYWAPTISMSFIPMWNPKSIKKDIVKYADLLDPEFKGLFVSGDPMKSESYLTYYMGLRKILDKEYMMKLAKQDILWLTRSPDVTTKVVTGERPVTFMGNNRTAYVAAMEGADIKVVFPKEGALILSNPFVTLAKAPHPNASKLLIDYVNSKEGQTLMVEKSGYFTAREDVPIPPKVLPFSPPFAKINIIPMDWKSITEKDNEAARKEFQAIFGK